MTIYEVIKAFVEMLTNATINGICIGFWVILLAEIWKWLWTILKAFFFDLFPGLRKDKNMEDDV